MKVRWLLSLALDTLGTIPLTGYTVLKFCQQAQQLTWRDFSVQLILVL